MLSKATPNTIHFFGGLSSVPTGAICPALTVSDVPADDEGLRILSAAGRWTAVAALAERLEGQRLQPSTMYHTEASLRYTLVRVQAYMALQMFDRAKHLFDTLGNLSDSRFSVDCSSAPPPVVVQAGSSSYQGGSAPSFAAKGRLSIVPFSLWFLHAQLPMLVSGQLMESQTRLYELLQRCESAGAASASGGERSMWRQRARRIRRALVANHFELEQFGPALTLQRDIADTETNELQHLLAMQMLGCMCLRSGNSTLATEVFRAIERMQVDDEAYDAETNNHLASTKEVMVALNHALLLSFHGYFAEACATLRNIMSGVPVAVPAVARDDGDGGGGGGVNAASAAACEEALATRQQLRRYAATSLCTCLPFLHRNDAPDAPPAQALNSSVSIPVLSTPAQSTTAAEQQHPLAAAPTPPPLPRTSVQSLSAYLDEQIRADPKGMLSLDAFVFNLYRVVDLENAAPIAETTAPPPSQGGGSASRTEVIENLLEQFRGWRDGRRGRGGAT